MISEIELKPQMQQATRPSGGKFRMTYMDGLRGLSAIIVATHHLYLRWLEVAGARCARWSQFLLTGHSVVAVFVVLSGYTLMLPVARAKDHHLVGGWRRFLSRRTRRILPTYYAGLAVAILPMLPRWIGWPHLPWAPVSATIDISFTSVLVHLLLIQNLKAAWGAQINSAFWSIATEWQLYFLFPLLLLPIWRRLGALATITVGLTLGIALGFWIGFQADGCPWYIGLFAMGMAGSGVSFIESGPRKSSLAGRLPWGWIFVSLLLIDIVILATQPMCLIITDPLFGLAATALLIRCTYRCQREHAGLAKPNDLFLNFLQSRALVFVGVMSYSLYLVHMPLIVIVQTLLGWLCGVHALASVWLLPPLSVGLVAVATYVFHHLIERPLMIGHPKTEEKAATSAALEPAI